MTRFQVTAKFKNVFEIVGADEVDEVEAHRLFRLYQNVGRKVRMHQVTGEALRFIKDANMGA